MKIISQFKDYYDFIAKQYGGGDPRIVYERNRILDIERELDFNIPLVNLRYGINYPDNAKKYSYLIVAGKAYMLSRPYGFFGDGVNSYKLEATPLDESNPSWMRYQLRDIEFGKEHPALIKLCRTVGHPVFVIRDIQTYWKSKYNTISVYEQCPILQKLGMASIISPQQMYQDLAYFVGNLMKESPDVEPPVELSNNQKIVKAGFDLVKSFRHRL